MKVGVWLATVGLLAASFGVHATHDNCATPTQTQILLEAEGVYIVLAGLTMHIWVESNGYHGLQYRSFYCNGQFFPGDQCLLYSPQSMVSQCVADALA